MTPHHPEARFQTPADLIDHYKAVNQRINTAGVRHEARQRLDDEVARRLEADETAKLEAESLRRAAEEVQRVDADLERVRILFAGTSKSRAITIIRDVARETGIEAEHLIGRSRRKHIVHARQDAIRRVRQELPHLGLASIGRLFGGRDHTTVLHALRKGAARV